MRTSIVLTPLTELFRTNKFVLEERTIGGALEEIVIVAVLEEGATDAVLVESGEGATLVALNLADTHHGVVHTAIG
ncbi:hypothetical protein JG688_00018570 [Phytophthora aleatoria]|uniref:Uncharacterized protein n=1 Tax=Phytophthora aleatoria TaxID=2496075 RepID=A0A8J5IPC4_9STRA|nr:hypothetical protein JG688_00018570 [Phytophthora aleatoria]